MNRPQIKALTTARAAAIDPAISQFPLFVRLPRVAGGERGEPAGL
ncbi:hypothetical protein BH24CHL5_BH24CHL5_07900 [soil metagenome]